MSKTYKTGFVITGDASGGVNALKMTRAEMDHLNATQKKSQGEWGNTNKAQRQAADTARLVEQSYGSLDQRLSNTAALVGRLAAGWLGFQGISSAIRIADDYGQMAARMRMATESAEEYQLVQERLLATAGGTYRPLEEAQELYIRTADALRSLGYETDQQLDITDSLSYLFVTNATSADRAASAINSFSRSLETGRVTSDDWQSMLTATPTLVDNIAAATGKTTAEIRRLGVTGKLAMTEVTEGLRLAGDENQRLADAMALTVEDALVRLRTNFASWIGESNESSGATLALANSIAVVAENIDVLANVAMAGGIVVAGRYTSTLAASTMATINDMKAKRAAAAAELQVAKAQAASTLAALRNANAQMTLFTGHAQAAAAAKAHTAALARLAAAQKGVMSVGRGLLGLLGGPVGLAVTAGLTAAAFIDWGSSAAEASVGTDDLTSSFEGLSAAAIKLKHIELTERLEREESAAAKAAAAHKDRQRQIDEGLTRSEGFRKETARLAVAHEEAAVKVELLKAALERLGGVKSGNNNNGKPITPPVDPEQEKAIARMTDQLVNQYVQLQLGERAYLTYQLAQQNATLSQTEQALAAFDAIEALKAQQQAEADALKARENAMAAYAAGLANSTKTSIKSLSDVEKQSQRVWSALADGKISSAQAAAAIDGLAAAGAGVVDEQQKWIDQMIAAMDPARDLEEQISRISEAQAEGLFGDLDDSKVADYLDALKKKLADVGKTPATEAEKSFEAMANRVAGTLQQTIASGDWQSVGVTIGGILAGEIGARVSMSIAESMTGQLGQMMAGVAGAFGGALVGGVLGYLVSGGLNRPWADDAAIRQEQQGTGTVLGDAAAKSESIAAALDLTADATRELVGINRAQLRALQAMQAGISGASARIAQGAGAMEFGAVRTPTNVFDSISSAGQQLAESPVLGFANALSFGLLGGIFKGVGKLLGGSSSVTDQGIQIIGGTMAELIEETMVQGYQTVRTRKYRWSSSKSSTSYAAMDDEIGQQFALVFESLAYSVYAGATALGFAGDEVAARINDFTLATQTISTKGLSAEQAEKEIEAVFSTLFDGLAVGVVDFLPKFQQAGEGLGETLARVATQVQVGQEAVSRLGFGFDTAEQIAQRQLDAMKRDYMGSVDLIMYWHNHVNKDGAKYTQLYNNALEEQARNYEDLIEKAGGMEAFLTGMGAFIDKFAPEAHKLDLAASDLQRALSDVGLALPATRDGFWALMQTLDGSTDAGRQQIAALLELTGTADAYYALLDQRNTQAVRAADQAAELHRKVAEQAAEQQAQLAAQRFDLENRLLRLQGNELGAVAREREKELEALDPTLKAIQRNINALQDYNRVMDAHGTLLGALGVEQSMDQLRAELSAGLRDAMPELPQFKFDGSTEIVRTGFLRFSRVLKRSWEEQIADYQRALEQAQLGTVSLSLAASREQFLEMAKAIDISTEAGREQMIALSELAPQLDAYYSQLEAIAAQRFDLETRLLRLQGNDLAAVAREREKELDALDPTLKALMQRIYAQEDANAAEEKATQLAQERQAAWEGYLGQLASWSQDELQQIEQAYRNQMDLLGEQARVARELRDYTQQLRLSDLSPAAPAEKLAAAGDQFAALLVRAQAGDLDAASKLQGAADTYLKNADAYYGRTDIYTGVFEDVAGQLERLGIGLGATSTEEHIASLNEQMLAEQQQVRDYLAQELDWAARQYDQLTGIAELLQALPESLSGNLNQLLNPDQPTHVMPIRPDGSHFNGLKRVPFDGYIAELHKDERVLTAAETAGLDRLDNRPLLYALQRVQRELEQLRAERARDAAKAEQQRNSQTDATETLVRVNRTPVKMT